MGGLAPGQIASCFPIDPMLIGRTSRISSGGNPPRSSVRNKPGGNLDSFLVTWRDMGTPLVDKWDWKAQLDLMFTFWLYLAKSDTCVLQSHTRQLPMEAGYCQWGGLTDRNICNIYGDAHLASRYQHAATKTHPHTKNHAHRSIGYCRRG